MRSAITFPLCALLTLGLLTTCQDVSGGDNPPETGESAGALASAPKPEPGMEPGAHPGAAPAPDRPWRTEELAVLSGLLGDDSRVVLGRVARLRAGFGVNEYGDRLILTEVELEVEETLVGAATDRLTFVLEGGTVGELTLDVSDLPTLRVGERGAFALRPSVDGRALVPLGRGLGIRRDLAPSALGALREALRDALRRAR